MSLSSLSSHWLIIFFQPIRDKVYDQKKVLESTTKYLEIKICKKNETGQNFGRQFWHQKLKKKYDVKVATGTILASGTLGQIIPPSIILILLGDVISSSYQEAS